jgi:LemA protein
MAFGIFVAVLLGLVILIIGIYNRLVSYRNQFKNAFAQIDVQLKRRYDLIPNLVETAKGYLKHERETLEAVISARTAAVSANKRAAASPGEADAMDGLMQAEGLLSGALGRLMMVSEAYPDLKANESMQQVMEELSSTENRVAFSRQAFNDGVTLYNTTREAFPNTLVAGLFNFDEAKLLEATESAEERQAPKVSFN